MHRILLLAVLSTFILVAGGSVSAMEFSADVITKSAGHAMNAAMYTKDGKMRMEMKEQGQTTIMRPDKNVVWMLMPDQKAYMEMAFDPKQQPKTTEKVQGEVSRKLIGSEKIDRYDTKKYEVTYKAAAKTDRMYQWITPEIQFPVKSAAIDGSWSTEYRNIKMGSQPDSLFEVPSGYKKMSMPAMPGMPGMSGKKGPRPGSAAE
jgi:outer membrane lipoprotein-sorting protein